MVDNYKWRGNIYRPPVRVHLCSSCKGGDKLGTYYTSRFIFVSNVNVPVVLFCVPIRSSLEMIISVEINTYVVMIIDIV